MARFKPGDRVRRIKSPNSNDMPVGSEWIVIRATAGMLAVKDPVTHVAYQNGSFASMQEYFELVKDGDNSTEEDDVYLFI